MAESFSEAQGFSEAQNFSEAQSFSRAQKQAITHLEGPAMVLAGPGSGKTTVITERVRFLIQDAGVDPASVLVVTFTKAAASEMKSRFLKLTGKASTAVSFGTFHSIFFSILRAAYHYTSADVISEKERMLLFREIIEELGLEIDDPADFIRNVSGEVGMVKGDHIDPANYYAMNCADDVFRQIYAAYQQKLVRSRKIDFEDMLIYTMDLFTKRPDILAAWQRKFCWILVDEFQDINRLQYEIIRMLALPENNLFIVGDDDQSIYRFRGAKPEIMLGFPKDYPKTRQILLDINYRCPGPVVSCSKRVIEHNQKRYAKALKAIRPAGERVDICGFENITKECQAVIDRIRIYHEGTVPYNQIAVLYRTNTDARMLATKLMEYTIPFRMRDSIPNIFEHWIARDIISYIKIACEKADRPDYLRVLNRPLRYISRKAISEAVLKAENQSVLGELETFYRDKDWMVERLQELGRDLKNLSVMQPYAAVTYIRYAIDYDTYLTNYAKDHRIQEEDLLEIASEICESAKNYKTFDEWFAYMDTYAKLLEEKRRHRQDTEPVDGVVLSTIHSAKGLEYQVVFVIDANEGVMPHKKAVMDVDIEEERRLFYVAMTRAKERLHIYYTRERYQKPAQASRFVDEIRGRSRSKKRRTKKKWREDESI